MLENKELKSLLQQYRSIKESLTVTDIQSNIIQNQSLLFSYAAAGITKQHLSAFQESIDKINLKEKIKALLNSEHINLSENSPVHHHQCRNTTLSSLYQDEYKRLKSYVREEHKKGRPEAIIQIGIGGSYLGPQMCIHALKPWVIANKIPHTKHIRFISNVDPDHVQLQLEGINLDKAQFIIVSKSGSTKETIANLELLKVISKTKKISTIESQCIGVTCKGSDLEKNYNFKEIFYIDDAIGGRFSTSSVVGMTLLALAYDTELTDAFLKGAYQQDLFLNNTTVQENASLLNACINIWFRNYCNYQALGIIPYNSALHYLPSFLQQLICESLGKQTTLGNKRISHQTSPIIFGEPGTNAQHSFFQMMHQGTTTTPLQFIGFTNQQIKGKSQEKNQVILNSNLCAQITGLALGKDNSDINKHFFGNRPSTLLIANQLNPTTLGELVSFYENTVLFEGFLLDINAFDQEGVQLGKTLATELLNQTERKNPITDAYSHLLKQAPLPPTTQ